MTSPNHSSGFGPSHQYVPPPRLRPHWIARVLLIAVPVAFELWAYGHAHPGSHPLRDLLLAGVAGGVLVVLFRHVLPAWIAAADTQPTTADRIAEAPDQLAAVRARSVARGGGAYLGLRRGAWVCADPQHAALVLGPPRSGKSSAIVAPSLMACPGAAVSTSTKPDVIAVTSAARRTLGETWLFDPTGRHDRGAFGTRALHWSPVAAADTWDGALLIARAMTLAAPTVGRGTQHGEHWAERAAALLAPLLYAAHETQRPIADVLRWVLRHDLTEPAHILAAEHVSVAGDVLVGIANTDERERSSILSATAGVLALYNSDSARAAAAGPNFDPALFAASADTVYITAPAHQQALCAPLIVGLLQQIRQAAYARAATDPGRLPVFFCLDELANIAPIPDLPAMVSEAGGQGLHVLACLQDLSQAKARWGNETAEGLLTLFQTKLLLPGICDPRTLEAVSVILGEYDRHTVTENVSAGTSGGWAKPLKRTGSEQQSVSYQTTRQRVLAPGDIAAIPAGHGLLLQGPRWTLLQSTPYYATRPWRDIASSDPPSSIS